VIPVLVGGAKMPLPSDLPSDIRDLTHRNAAELSDLRWSDDIDRLLVAAASSAPMSGEAKSTAKSTVKLSNLPSSEAKPRRILKALLWVLGIYGSIVAVSVFLDVIQQQPNRNFPRTGNWPGPVALGSVCRTNKGVCRINGAAPVGTQCYCSTPWGPDTGSIVP
jgi:hypothetical protein